MRVRDGRSPKLLVTTGIALLVLSASSASAASANISRSYQAKTAIVTGSLVSLDTGDSNQVVSANSDNAKRLVGVAVRSGDSLLAVDASTGKVQVATSGSVS